MDEKTLKLLIDYGVCAASAGLYSIELERGQLDVIFDIGLRARNIVEKHINNYPSLRKEFNRLRNIIATLERFTN